MGLRSVSHLGSKPKFNEALTFGWVLFFAVSSTSPIFSSTAHGQQQQQDDEMFGPYQVHVGPLTTSARPLPRPSTIQPPLRAAGANPITGFSVPATQDDIGEMVESSSGITVDPNQNFSSNTTSPQTFSTTTSSMPGQTQGSATSASNANGSSANTNGGNTNSNSGNTGSGNSNSNVANPNNNSQSTAGQNSRQNNRPQQHHQGQQNHQGQNEQTQNGNYSNDGNYGDDSNDGNPTNNPSQAHNPWGQGQPFQSGAGSADPFNERALDLMYSCQHEANLVDQQCGPNSPAIGQASFSLQRQRQIKVTKRNLEATFRASLDAIGAADKALSSYIYQCESQKIQCHNTCAQALQFAGQSDRLENQVYSIKKRCNASAHASRLTQAKADRQGLAEDRAIAAAGYNMVETGDSDSKGDGGAKSLVATDFDSGGAAGKTKRGKDDDKFDLYSDEMKPGFESTITPTESKAQSTNYAKKGGAAAGPLLGGAGTGTAGYRATGGRGGSGEDDGKGGSVSPGSASGGGIITGYSNTRASAGGTIASSTSGAQSDFRIGSGSSRRLRQNRDPSAENDQAKYRPGMNLGDFLPGGARDPERLKLAAFQKRDGITGPTGPTIWTKVSSRYRVKQDSLLPP